jgi:hypothetical protein
MDEANVRHGFIGNPRPSVLGGETKVDVGREDTVGDGAHDAGACLGDSHVVHEAGVSVATRGIIEQQSGTGVFVIWGGACEPWAARGEGEVASTIDSDNSVVMVPKSLAEATKARSSPGII